MVSPPAVTAVVLNWCGEVVTTECLRSLLASDYKPLKALLVDNGSPDGSFERLRALFPNLDFIQTGKNLGYAGGNNRGIEWAMRDGADYVLILNNDIDEIRVYFQRGLVVRPENVNRPVRLRLGCMI